MAPSAGTPAGVSDVVKIEPRRASGTTGHGRTHRIATAVVVVAMLTGSCTASTPSVIDAGEQATDVEATPVPTAVEEAPATDTGTDTRTGTDNESADDAAEPADADETPAATDDRPDDPTDADETPAATDPEPPSASTERPMAPNGRAAPIVAANPVELAAQIATSDAALLDPSTSPGELPDWGHLHQVAIRKLGYEPAWDIDVFTALPPDIVERTILHVSARRALLELHSGYDAADFVPAWEIVEPEPLDDLVAHYAAAEAATGIEWEYLAAINLIETGMGRIRGLSSAGAQGPMQFLPTTWDEAGIGAGDINDPGDAIAAAARYLVRRGGPADMPGAIWGYNNSDNYVTAVLAYAELLRNDPAAYRAIYHWEIYFSTDAGDVWLPTGFRTDHVLDLDDYLAANPWSVPDPGLA